jgi:hypothetical protein
MGGLRWPEAVGYPYVGATVHILCGCYPGYQELDELAALLESLLGVLFDLAGPLS